MFFWFVFSVIVLILTIVGGYWMIKDGRNVHEEYKKEHLKAMKRMDEQMKQLIR